MHQSAWPTAPSSGLLFNKSGWHAVNWGSRPFLMRATSATLWLMWAKVAD